jgi:site-specific DNA-methyltransferase (adenine-specific)
MESKYYKGLFDVPDTPKLRVADVSRCPSINFFNVDCIEFMKSKPDKCYDLAIVDPEFGIGIGNSPRLVTDKGLKAKEWDNKPIGMNYFIELFRISKNQIIWGGNYANLPATRCFLIWDKVAQLETMADCEFAWTSFDKNAKIFRHVRNTSEKRIHITQKPIQLYEWILNKYANENDKILDTHLGSGSIAIAIDKANTLDKKNLTFVGIELDPDYFRAAVERFKNHKRQCVLF